MTQQSPWPSSPLKPSEFQRRERGEQREQEEEKERRLLFVLLPFCSYFMGKRREMVVGRRRLVRRVGRKERRFAEGFFFVND